MTTKTMTTRFGIISRKKGHNAVKAAAYRSGEALYDEKNNATYDYSRKHDVIHAEIMAPENAHEWMKDRSQLWSNVETIEKRKDSQLARNFLYELPRELDHETHIKTAQEYIQEQFVSKGMVADFAIHDGEASDGGRNPHLHVMLTFKEITPDGFGNKNRDWNDKSNGDLWRGAWAEKMNDALKEAGIEARYEAKSYEEQGINKIPGEHLGKDAAALEKQGIETEIGNENRYAQAVNDFVHSHAPDEDLHFEELPFETPEEIVWDKQTIDISFYDFNEYDEPPDPEELPEHESIYDSDKYEEGPEPKSEPEEHEAFYSFDEYDEPPDPEQNEEHESKVRNYLQAAVSRVREAPGVMVNRMAEYANSWAEKAKSAREQLLEKYARPPERDHERIRDKDIDIDEPGHSR